MRAALHHAGVDVGGGREARLEHADGGQQVGDEQRVHDEAGAVLRPDDVLAEHAVSERLGLLARLGRGEQRRDQLDEMHHRHRVEEVHADDGRWAARWPSRAS